MQENAVYRYGARFGQAVFAEARQSKCQMKNQIPSSKIKEAPNHAVFFEFGG
jgi:hypothetical protein